MVAEDIVGHLLGRAGQQLEFEPRLKLGEKAVSGPAFLQEEVLEAGFVAVFAQALLLAEDLRHGAHHGQHLIGKDEGIEANGKVRFL
jgi:hypothetical protein